MIIKKHIVRIISLIGLLFLLYCCKNANNNIQQKENDTLSSNNPVNKTNSLPIQENDIIPQDTLSFSYLLYLHSVNKNPNKALLLKYLTPDMLDIDPEKGIYSYVNAEEIYKIDTLVIIVYSYYTEDPGSQNKDTYVASFTKNEKKIDQNSFTSLTTTEWNNIDVSYEYTKDNNIQRKSIDQSYSPENGGAKVIKSDTLIEEFQIEGDGKINIL
jgi:hypothetical protein